MNMAINEDYLQPSITFLNKSGDITITWDEQNKDKIIELIRKKMSEGYTFFTTKKVPLLPSLTRRVKITKKNIEQCESVLIDDAAFEKMVASIDDKDVATLVRDGKGQFVKRTNKPFLERTIERDPQKVAEGDSLGVRKLAGG